MNLFIALLDAAIDVDGPAKDDFIKPAVTPTPGTIAFIEEEPNCVMPSPPDDMLLELRALVPPNSALVPIVPQLNVFFF